MKKCFEGINELIFNNNSEIIGMKSSEKEEIEFQDKIIPKSYKSNVEKWLLKVEESMKSRLQKIMEDSYMDLQNFKDKKPLWIKKWPG